MRPSRDWSADPKPLRRWAPRTKKQAEEDRSNLIRLLPTQIAEKVVNLRDGGGMPFTTDRRPYLLPVYNSWHPRMVLIGGRQIEKSTTLGNFIWIPAVTLRGFRSLYVAPTDFHRSTFAYDKLQGTLDVSPHLVKLLGRPRIDNQNHKEFSRLGTSLLLRSAYLTARSSRGIPADQLLIDEAQDMIPDHLPVLQETLTHSHHDEFGRRIVIAGTALTDECMIGEYWKDHSTQGEWVCRCSAGHANILELENISERGLICSAPGCGKILDPTNPANLWDHQFPSRKDLYVGYRIPQIINPTVIDHWSDIWRKIKTYSNARIQQEVLGRSYDVGTRPVSKSQMLRMEMPYGPSKQIEHVETTVMGVDWGYGDVSYSVLTIGGWNQHNKFQIIYAKRYRLGEEINPEYQLQDIMRLYVQYRVAVIGLDFGAGWGQNSRLKAKLGDRVADFYYAHAQKTKIKWNRPARRYVVHRTETMSDLFETIKNGNMNSYKGYFEEFGQDFLNVSTVQDSMGRTMFTHAPSRPDDAVHSLNYAFMIGRIMRKEIRPLLDDPRVVNQHMFDGDDDM